jgi:RNA polymerase sigma factor (sigma-70 family)
MLAIEAALEKLEKLSPRQAKIVELRCFAGLTVEEVAEALEISERTIATEWRLARAWLTRELDQGER